MPMVHLEKARLSLTGKEAAGTHTSARGNYVGSSYHNSLGQTILYFQPPETTRVSSCRAWKTPSMPHHSALACCIRCLKGLYISHGQHCTNTGKWQASTELKGSRTDCQPRCSAGKAGLQLCTGEGRGLARCPSWLSGVMVTSLQRAEAEAVGWRVPDQP